MPYHQIQILTSYSILPKILYGASDTSGKIPTEATGVLVEATCSKQDQKCNYLEYTLVDICDLPRENPVHPAKIYFLLKAIIVREVAFNIIIAVGQQTLGLQTLGLQDTRVQLFA